MASGGAASSSGSAGAGGAGGNSGGQALPTGTVVENADCTVPGAAPAGTECKALTVSCPSVPDIDVELLVIPPAMPANERGTVVLGSGGPGTSYYNQGVVGGLRQLGFRTVNRRWSFAWETGPGGMAAAACRYATMLSWVSQQSWQQGPLCATGNSGGSAEISYALARYGSGALLTAAVPSAGPPMGRLDHGCIGSTAWDQQCQQLWPSQVCAGQSACSFNANARTTIDLAYADSPCTDQDASAEPTLLADSVLSPDATLAYPNTALQFIFGTDDCSEAVSLGLVYAEAVTSNKTISYVDAPHAVFNTAAGRSAIVDALDQDCLIP
jgi:hypothetical protein